jgi:Tol biopolymer transport system component/DNA-binding winged helix-turn-helix (wHTH) protein
VNGDFLIGERLIQPRINCIQHGEDIVHLEPKIMQVLLVLASNPGEVFTREDIRNVVWRDVFVGDDVLMRAISEIRRIFDDDPRTPHTVQTVPKVGYRLIASVRAAENRPVSDSDPAHAAALAEPVPAPVSAAHNLPQPVTPAQAAAVQPPSPLARWFRWTAIGASALALLALAALISRKERNVSAATPEPAYWSHPLTTYPGSQLQPALSPGGDAIAFIWNQNGQTKHLYVKSLRSDVPVRITSGTGDELNPAWSPDGHSIAFIRRSEREADVEIIPSLGGSERSVYRLPVNSVWEYGGLTWSADGSSLIFPQQSTPGGPSELVQLSLSDYQVHPLTTPPAGWNGDSMPQVSPDGNTLAFARGAEQSTRDIYLMQLPNGQPHQLTFDARLILGLAWSEDGKNIVFSSDRGGSPGLWRVPMTGGAPTREMAGSDGAYAPTIARHGDLLAYTHGTARWTIASVPLGGAKSDTEDAVLTSSEQDALPQVSPSGDKLAFQSWRSGMQEIWISGVDGSNPVQITSQGASAGSPSWSNDGRWIAFDARPYGFPHIYITDASGGPPHAITSGMFSDIVPSWSKDDRWIYFGSNRTGSWQIWRISADGRQQPQQVTSEGGMVAKEDRAGKWLYFTQIATPGIWRRLVSGGPEEKIYDGPPTGDQDYWTLYGNQLFALSPANAHLTLTRVDLDTGRATAVYLLKHDPTSFGGLTVTLDGKHLLFAELIEAESNIALVGRYH